MPGGGNILAFNNREGLGTSIVCEITPPYFGMYNYYIEPSQAYGPAAPTWTYTAAGFYSNHLGGCQRLPNGNTLIARSTTGYLFEVDSAGQTQWSYNRGGEIARALHYGVTHPGVIALGLTSRVDATPERSTTSLMLGQSRPNPCSSVAEIEYRLPSEGHVTLKVFDVNGREILTLVDGVEGAGAKSVPFDAGGLRSGTLLPAGGVRRIGDSKSRAAPLKSAPRISSPLTSQQGGFDIETCISHRADSGNVRVHGRHGVGGFAGPRRRVVSVRLPLAGATRGP